MKTKISPAFVGAFVIGAFALGITALLSFGGLSLFSKPQRFVVYFNESIHGLDAGSPVKLRGVRVGRVANLNVRYDEVSNRSVVTVVCEFSRDVVTDSNGGVIDVADRVALQSLVDRGLRAQLGVLGLATGLLFVELNFVNPKEYPVDPKVSEARYVVVPAVPSVISEFQTSVGEILANLKKIDFAGLSREVTGLMADGRKQLAGLDLKGMVGQWKKTGERVEALANGPEFKQTFENLNGAVADLRRTIAKVDAQIEPNGQALAATLTEAKTALGSFNEAATTARKFIATYNGLGEEFVTTLQQFNEAADAVKRLADFLERNPNALLTGKKWPQ
ncbi:MAG: MCE family protein [Opitutus sp.]|nr:MCE family protein [Opitutus sp.]